MIISNGCARYTKGTPEGKVTMKRFLFAIMVILIPAFPHAAEKPLWVEAEGQAVLSDIETPREVKERARRDAERNAVEQAVGTFIRAHSLVSNSQLVEDLVYAGVRGKIDKIKIFKEGWDQNDRNVYRVHLRALVKPVYPEKLISLKVSLSKRELSEGDEVKVFYQANRDCHVYIFSVAADGSVTLLFPNSMNPDNAIHAGKAYQFPPRGSKIKLQARFLPGYEKPLAEEKIKLIATRHKEEIIPLGFQEGLFRVFDTKSTGMISDLVKRLSQLEPADWTEASVAYWLKR